VCSIRLAIRPATTCTSAIFWNQSLNKSFTKRGCGCLPHGRGLTLPRQPMVFWLPSPWAPGAVLIAGGFFHALAIKPVGSATTDSILRHVGLLIAAILAISHPAPDLSASNHGNLAPDPRSGSLRPECGCAFSPSPSASATLPDPRKSLTSRLCRLFSCSARRFRRARPSCRCRDSGQVLPPRACRSR